MGLRSRQTREELAKWEAEPGGESFAEFLEDLAEHGIELACEDRILTVGAMVRWIAANDGRSEEFARTLAVKGEIMVHDCLRIVDAAEDKDDVPVAKLRSALRLQVASHWNERYRARVQVDHSGEVRIDAGLVGFAGDLLERVIGSGSAVPVRPPVPDADVRGHSSEALALPGPAGAVMAEQVDGRVVDVMTRRLPPRTMTIVGPDTLVREVPYAPYEPPEYGPEDRV